MAETPTPSPDSGTSGDFRQWPPAHRQTAQFPDLPDRGHNFCFIRPVLAAAIGLALVTNAYAQTKHVPMLGKNLENYTADRIDPRYAPHPSGGDTRVFTQRYAASAARGESWRIVSDCASACTIGFGHYPKSRICIGGWVKLGFHLGENERAAAQMWNSYPVEIQALVNSHGGMRREWTWIPAAEFHRLGYRPC